MKITSFALTLATAGSLVAAQPHKHHHRHANHVKRVPDVTVVNVPGPTVTAYELNGQQISDTDVCKGIANGSLKWADGVAPPDACPSSSAAPAPSSAAPAVSSAAPAQFYAKPSSAAAPSSTQAASPSAAPSSQSSSSSGSSSGSSGGQGLDQAFPDGQLDCSTFPSDYGAIRTDWLNLNGWTGIQHVTVSGGQVTKMSTGVSGDSCTEGSMCSYACPPGYQKSQWPSTQGSTGQSVGGLSCSGGKLHLTNSALSNNLCIRGTGNVQVKNTMSEQVAVCRTDYPGTEAETVPLSAGPGQTQPLTCPDASKYYVWQNSATSAQYYVNPKGVSVSDGCQWGSPSQPRGNYAPVNLGVGTTSAGTFISIMPNKPTTDATLDFTIEIQGDLGGSCKYQNGQFITDSGTNSNGCTVQVKSGTATYVFSD